MRGIRIPLYFICIPAGNDSYGGGKMTPLCSRVCHFMEPSPVGSPTSHHLNTSSSSSSSSFFFALPFLGLPFDSSFAFPVAFLGFGVSAPDNSSFLTVFLDILLAGVFFAGGLLSSD